MGPIAKANIHYKTGAQNAAIRVLDEILNQEGASLADICRALNLKSRSFLALGKFEEVLAIADTLIDRGRANLREAGVGTSVGYALLRKGVALDKLGRPEEAEASYRAVVGIFSDVETDQGRMIVARGLISLGDLRYRSGDNAEALRYYGDVIARFSTTTRSILLTEEVCRAYLKKAAVMSSLGLVDEELLAYDALQKLVQIRGDSEFLPEYLAAARVNKAITLAKTGRAEEAQKLAREVVQQFGSYDDDSVIEQASKAAKLEKVLGR